MLQHLTLRGFKSIKEMDIELRALNILIGANGAGKSNLVSFFKMLNEIMAGRLQEYIGISGRSQSFLHFGAKRTKQIEAQLEFNVENGIDTYEFSLSYAAGDTLIFVNETLQFLQNGRPSPRVDLLGVGHQETKITEASEEGKLTARTLKYLLNRCRVYHFHDTSSTSALRQSCYIGDNRWLMPDGGNLAALLLRFREENDLVYQRIVRDIRLIAPFFDDFDIQPDSARRVILNWRAKGSDHVFGPHQFSDGTLRAICLATLLLQPDAELPELIVVDEPELGLHPYALTVVASMINKVASRGNTQILISTQSSSLLDKFEPEDVIVVNRVDEESQFKRLTNIEYESWLEDYSLGEIWERNIIGGGPH
jgi:predicted ATPase